MKDRKDYMTAEDRKSMGAVPRTHDACMELTGKARPGKTAHDRAKKSRPE